MVHLPVLVLLLVQYCIAVRDEPLIVPPEEVTYPPPPPPKSDCLIEPEESKLFHSEDFPNRFNRNYDDRKAIDCNYTMKTTEGKKVLLTFFHLELDTYYQCRSGRLAFYHGNGTIKQIICGQQFNNFKVLSDNAALTFNFLTEKYTSSRGWLAKWESVDGDFELESEKDTGKFLMTYPAKFRAGAEEKVCLEQLEKDAPPLDLVLTFYPYQDGENTTGSDFWTKEPSQKYTTQIAGGSRGCLEKVMLEKGEGQVDSAFMRVVLMNGEEVVEEMYRSITILGKETQIIVQTDKGKYLSGDTVKFRVVVIDEDLKMVEEGIQEITVQDSNFRTVQKWNNEALGDSSLLQKEFVLFEESPLGDWSIKVTTDKMVSSATFEVAEYVLPKFEVSIVPPAAILKDGGESVWKVCGKYTHGAAVKGDVEAAFYTPYPAYSPWSRNSFRANPVFVNKTAKVSEEDDCAHFFLSKEDLKELKTERTNQVNMDAKLIEAGTGTAETSSSTNNKIVDKEIILNFGTSSSSFILGGFPYTGEIKATNHDGSPRTNEKLEVCTRLFKDLQLVRDKFNGMWGFSEDDFIAAATVIDDLTYRNSCKQVVTDESGSIQFSVPLGSLPKDIKKLSIKVRAIDLVPAQNSSMVVPEEKLDVDLTHTTAPASLSINSKDKKSLACNTGSNVEVYLSGKKGAVHSLKYFAISGGEEYFAGTQEVTLTGEEDDRSSLTSGRQVFSINDIKEADERFIKLVEILVPINHKAYPTVKFVVLVVEGNDTLRDSHDFKVDFCLENQVDLTLTTDKSSPGESVGISVKTEGDSMCGVSLIDKSVYLLGNNNQVTKEKIGELKQSFKSNKGSFYNGNYQISSKCPDVDTFLQEFNSAGVEIISNLPFFENCQTVEIGSDDEEEPFYEQAFGDGNAMNRRVGVMMSSMPMEMVAGESFNKGSGPEELIQPPIRTNFPETWLFELEPVQGELNKDLTVPDTLTSWVAEAVCMNPRTGLGLANSKQLTVSQNFFADLRLPHSVKRGEIFPLNISVFNNMDQDLPITLTISSEKVRPGQEVFQLCVKGSEVVSVPTKADAVGDIDILVTATIENHQDCTPVEQGVGFSDRLSMPLRVKPEGIPVEKVESDLKCFESGESSIELEALRVPENTVEDSARAWVHVSGDIMAPALENIGNLVNMPTGCGEQNMVGLAPNIYLLQYLSSNPQSAPELEAKAKKYMEVGYNRQQKYRHPNGGYSIWGGQDEKQASTWLTAFVVKVFSQASEFISVNEDKLKESVEWLLSSQLENGCFEKRGYVHSSSLQGGNSEDSLSGFVLTALVEAGARFGWVKGGKVQEALRCVIDRRNETDLYSMSLATYAANLYRAKLAEGALDTSELSEDLVAAIDNMTDSLLSRANSSVAGALFWDQVSTVGDSWWTYSRSSAVEMTAYNIMSLAFTDKSPDQAVAAVKWLARQRNSQGGFVSTQDTVVALQALSVYGTKVNKYTTNMKVQVMGNGSKLEELNLDQNNAVLLQTVRLGEVPSTVEFKVEGSGCVLVQSVLRYNTPEITVEPSFSLKVENMKDKLAVCTAYTGQRESTGMVLVEVELVSGYRAVDPESLVNEIDSGVERVEVEDKENRVVLYFNNINKEQRCVDLQLKQEFEVKEAKPARVAVYDYYKPEERSEITYTLK